MNQDIVIELILKEYKKKINKSKGKGSREVKTELDRSSKGKPKRNEKKGYDERVIMDRGYG